jgi:protein-tyrosine phosphatase
MVVFEKCFIFHCSALLLKNILSHIMDQINEYLWISDFESSSDIESLVSNNIKTVINVSQTKQSPQIIKSYQQHNIEEYLFYFRDLPNINIRGPCRIIHFQINKRKQFGGVLIHCQPGLNRSACAVTFHLINCGMKLSDTWTLLKEKRKCIMPTEVFTKQIYTEATRCDML